MMALPAMLVLLGAAAQVMITSQSRVHLEQAAYAAARAALAHQCPPFHVLARMRTPGIPARPPECMIRRSELDAIAQARAEDAARWALIAAAPTTGAASARGCDQVRAAEQILTSGDIHGRDQAAINAICYVFEPGNVSVDLEWVQSAGTLVSGASELPIRATVTFRYELSTPFRRFVYEGQRGDGTYWRSGTATVTLL